MASDPVFTQSSEAPVVTTSSLDGDPKLKATWNDAWDQIDVESSQSAVPEAPEPPPAVEEPKQGADDHQVEPEPVRVTRHHEKPKRKLSEFTHAPSPDELNRDLDEPKSGSTKEIVASII